MCKVWFITGAARGIGKSIADAALRNGDSVIATTKKANDFIVPEGYDDHILTFQLDVANTDQTVFDDTVKQAVDKFGRIDVLVNNAGYGSVTFFEETEEETIKKQFEVNLFGLMRVTRAVLPVMRKQRSGHIINIASGSGMFRTSFYDKGTWRITPDKHIEDYDSCRWQDAFIANNDPQGNPDKLAQLILEVAETENPPLHLAIRADAPAVLDAYAEKLKSDTDAWREKAMDTSY